MFGLEKLFGNKPSDLTLAKDKIAEILSMNPEALDAFEKAYNKASIDAEESCEYLNAKTMAQTKAGNIPSNCFDIVSIAERIAKELIDGTKVYRYTRNKQDATYLTLKETLPSTYVKPSDLASSGIQA